MSFRDDLKVISAFVGIPTLDLATIVREAEAAEAMRATSDNAGLLAARDREKGHPGDLEESPEVDDRASS
jgi:hypothetical protein